MRSLCRFVLIILCTLLNGCSNSVTMSYESIIATENTGSLGPSVVTVSSVNDARGVGSLWVGAIRSSYGFPIKVLESSKPVQELVKIAFEDGLRSRKLLSSSKSKLSLEIVINKLDCSQLIRREAHVHLIINVVSSQNHRSIKAFPVTVDVTSGSIFTLDFGFFASVEDLMKIMNGALHDAVDKFLENPEFRAIIRGADKG